LPMPITMQPRSLSTHSNGVFSQHPSMSTNSNSARGRSNSPAPDKLQGGDWRANSNASAQHQMRSRSPSVCSKTGKPLAMAPLAKFAFVDGGLGNDRSLSPVPSTKAVLSASPTDVGPSEAGPSLTVTAETSKESLPENTHALSRSWALWEKTVASDDPTSNDESDDDADKDKDKDKDPCSYSACVSQVKTFNSIETFMPLFNGVPPPSAIVNKNHIFRQMKSPFFDFTTSESSESESEICSRPSVQSILGRRPLPDGLSREMKQLDAIMFFEAGVTPTWEDAAHTNGGVMEFTFKTDFPGDAVDEIWERVLFAVLGNSIANGDFVTGVRMADRLPLNLQPTLPIVGVRFELWHRAMAPEMAFRLRADVTDIITAPTFHGGHVVARNAVHKGTYATKTSILHMRRAPVSQEREAARNGKRGSV